MKGVFSTVFLLCQAFQFVFSSAGLAAVTFFFMPRKLRFMFSCSGQWFVTLCVIGFVLGGRQSMMLPLQLMVLSLVTITIVWLNIQFRLGSLDALEWKSYPPHIELQLLQRVLPNCEGQHVACKVDSLS